MNSPLDSFPSEHSDSAPKPLGAGAPEGESSLGPDGLSRVLPPWVRPDRLSVIVTAACTSAGVSLLTMWLWDQGHPPGMESIGAVSELRELTEAPAPPEAVPPATNAPLLSGVTAATLNPSEGGEIVRAAETSSLPRLTVITQPAGARVTINGVGWGNTPLIIRYLQPGAKRIRVTKSGYRSEERIVGVNSSGAAATLRIVLREIREARASQ